MKKRKNATHNEEFLWTGSCIQGLKKPSLEEVCGFHIIREIKNTFPFKTATFNKYLMSVKQYLSDPKCFHQRYFLTVH